MIARYRGKTSLSKGVIILIAHVALRTLFAENFIRRLELRRFECFIYNERAVLFSVGQATRISEFSCKSLKHDISSSKRENTTWTKFRKKTVLKKTKMKEGDQKKAKLMFSWSSRTNRTITLQGKLYQTNSSPLKPIFSIKFEVCTYT